MIPTRNFVGNQTPHTNKCWVNSAFDGSVYDGNEILTNLATTEAFFGLHELKEKIIITIV